MAYQASGMAMQKEMATSLRKSLDSRPHRVKTPAPNILRTPISLVRCSATKEARPKSPIQEIKIAREVKTDARLPMRCSVWNFRAYSSSVKLYRKGLPGLYFLKRVSRPV